MQEPRVWAHTVRTRLKKENGGMEGGRKVLRKKRKEGEKKRGREKRREEGREEREAIRAKRLNFKCILEALLQIISSMSPSFPKPQHKSRTSESLDSWPCLLLQSPSGW